MLSRKLVFGFRKSIRRLSRSNFLALPSYLFLIAIYPVLALAATNISEIRIADTFRALSFSILMASILLLALAIILRNFRKAAILSSLFLVAAFSYGHIYTLLKPISIGDFLVGRHRYLVPVYLGAVLVASWIIVRKKEISLSAISLLNLAAAIAIVAPLFSIGTTLVQSQFTWNNLEVGSLTEDLGPELPELETLPDIYYIVVDAYGRSDQLQERFEFDNSQFETFLMQRGFYIAKEANTNYFMTALSLGSSLNLDYFSALGIDPSQGGYPNNFRELIVHSRARQLFEGLGYSTIAFPTGYIPTEIQDADYFLTPDMSKFEDLRQVANVNAFEEMMITSTAARLLIDLDTLANTRILTEMMATPEGQQRLTILSAFDRLGGVGEIPGPKFVFAHIISPHGPYLFGPNGEPGYDIKAFSLGDPLLDDGWAKDVPKYLDQVTYVNTRLQEAIEAILANSVSPPIILLQSDHGPQFGLDWDVPKPDEKALVDRAGILSAYYLPEDCQQNLYPTISPVNSFRIVVNCISGRTYDLLDDISYHNPHYSNDPWEPRPYEEFFD